MDKEQAYEAIKWLNETHRWAMAHLDVDMAKVNPKTHSIDDDPKKNTLIEYWLEGGPMVNDENLGYMWSHDINLDTGGESFEEAIVDYARLVRKHYGDKETDSEGVEVKE